MEPAKEKTKAVNCPTNDQAMDRLSDIDSYVIFIVPVVGRASRQVIS